ncbi:MAG: M23 family metallopeptidase [Patescibacteria group bacterium]
MRYHALLKLLQILIYLKRAFWWLGAKSLFILAKLFYPLWKVVGFVDYKLRYVLRKINSVTGFSSKIVKRDSLQVIVLAILLFIAMPQTKLYAKKDLSLPGQKTIAFALLGSDEEYSIEEVVAETEFVETDSSYSWRDSVLSSDQFVGGVTGHYQDLAGLMAGGMALSKPYILPGSTAITGQRDFVIEYMVEPGDSLSVIAARFGVSVATVLWENNLGLRSYIRPGDKLRILPVNGVRHIIKKGDNLNKIAVVYGTKPAEIVKYNKLKEDGSDLIIGESIIIPDGEKPQQRIIVASPGSAASLARRATPPPSRQSPTISGFVWPTAARLITQYYSWRHPALDIAGGNKQTPIYAAKSGTVRTSQCGWNNGYGCYIIIDHGGGVITLYGHNSKLLVSPGDVVVTGDTIAMMGNTGRVRGRTGIHTHFEIKIGKTKVNPLGYVK